MKIVSDSVEYVQFTNEDFVETTHLIILFRQEARYIELFIIYDA